MKTAERQNRILLRSVLRITLAHPAICECVGCCDVYKRIALKNEDAADRLLEWLGE